MKQPGRLVLLGHPVAHSLSPAFQNAALRRAGLPLTYESLDVKPAALPATVAKLISERAAGNVTIPHKAPFFELCDDRTDIATRVGAVNTFWSDGSKLFGDNTDVGGFQRAVTDQLRRAPKGVLTVFGSGGSAAAVCAASEAWEGVEVRIVSRSPERARALAEKFAGRAKAVDDPERALKGASLVVNATPQGMKDDDSLPVRVDLLPRDALVVDVVYRRGGTPWVRAAREAGVMAVDGLSMLVEQGALAFERWFGFAPARDAMWSAVQ